MFGKVNDHAPLICLILILAAVSVFGHHLLVNHEAGSVCLLSFCAFIVAVTLFIIPLLIQSLPTVELAVVQREHTDTFFKPPRS